MRTQSDDTFLLRGAVVALWIVAAFYASAFSLGYLLAPPALNDEPLPDRVLYTYQGVSVLLLGSMFYAARRWGQQNRFRRLVFAGIVAAGFLLSPCVAAAVSIRYGRKAMNLSLLPAMAMSIGWQIAPVYFPTLLRRRAPR